MNNKAKTMRILGIIASASATLMLTACSSQTTVSGIISDASMNTVTVSTADGETVTFGTMEADRSQCNGLPLGAPITVTYSGRIEDNFATAVKISTPAEYCLLIGDWILLTESTEMGISIRVEGEAASINMATLQYEGWSLDNGKQLTVNGEGLTITNLDTETGNVEIEGKAHQFAYSVKQTPKSILKKIFK